MYLSNYGVSCFSEVTILGGQLYLDIARKKFFLKKMKEINL